MARRNNVSMRKRRNNVSMRKRRNNISMRKRRNNVSMRNRRMMYGGYSAPVSGNSMGPMQVQSLAQGDQFLNIHKNQHGGALNAGPFPGAVTEVSVLPENLHASARVAPLDAAIREIQGLKDQSGGRRRRRGTKKSRKGKKTVRKGRKSSRRQYGGAWSLGNEQSVTAPGMILSSGMEAKAVSGMNAEWKLAEDPKSFAPGYKSF